MPDTLAALASNDPEFQLSALTALNRIYEADNLKNGKLGQIDHEFIKTKLTELSLIEITPENESSVEHLLDEIDVFYRRHFQ